MLAVQEPKAAPAAKPKATKATSKAPATKAAARPALSEADPNQSKSLEEVYQKKTPLEHILLRPDTYIGSTEKQQQKMWVHNGEELVHEEIEYVPGLYKIFDEILVNAADNKVRDPSMDSLTVSVDAVRPFAGRQLVHFLQGCCALWVLHLHS